jgi:adenylate kinase
MSTVKLVILGRQGSGKGTQSERVVERFGVVHISTGDMLRTAVSAGTDLGLRAKALMDAGELVPDEIMNGIVEERLAQEDVVQRGFLLDGFPRTPAQAETLERIVGDGGLDVALNLDVAVDEVTSRMLARGREDDTEASIRRRLELYEQETAPLLSWFASRGLLVTIDGVGSEDEVFARVAAAIEERHGPDCC